MRPSEIASKLGIGRASVYRILAISENSHAMVVTPADRHSSFAVTPRTLFDHRKGLMEDLRGALLGSVT
jgi:hypothetical protein